jgi:hypothetical protein
MHSSCMQDRVFATHACSALHGISSHAGIGGFIACKALSKRNDDPAGASRPWDAGRDGFVMGEGSGVLVLESEEHAIARGARIYAEVLGGAANCDAHHITEPRPDGSGVSACIRQALQRTGVAPEEVSYVNAHGTSTPAGDMAEYRAIRAAIPTERCDAFSPTRKHRTFLPCVWLIEIISHAATPEKPSVMLMTQRLVCLAWVCRH